MVKLTQFSNKNFEEAKPFTPTYPDSGKKIEGVTLWVKSSKSKDALPIIDSVSEEALARQLKMQQTGIADVSTERAIKDDIELACAVLTKFEGLSNDDESELVCTKESMRVLMSEYDWLRAQVLTKANTAAFFYKSE